MNLKRLLPVLLSLTALIAVPFAGCSSDKENKNDGNRIVSYISEAKSVYSSTADVVEAVADTVVEISTETVKTQWGQQYIVSGAGSGVVVGENGNTYYIITNNHVIEGASEISVTTRSGVSYSAELLSSDDSADIAVITVVSRTTLELAVWGDSDNLRTGEDLIAIGNPMGSLGGTVTKGILSAKDRIINVGNYAMTLLQTDTAINPGNSGGGLFNMRGELIGVVNAKTTDEEIEGICFAIPANTAREVYNDLVQYGYIYGRATLGLTLSEGALAAGGINSQSQSVVYVKDAGDSPENTFEKYDRIYSLNGVKISTVLEYNIAMSKITAGETVAVEVYRGRETQGYFGSNITFDTELTSFNVRTSQYGA